MDSAKPFHDYTVSFLAYIMWDPVHMYNAVVNDWKDVVPQITSMFVSLRRENFHWTDFVVSSRSIHMWMW